MAEPNRKNIVILGGSYGGISVAHYLLQHVLPRLPSDAPQYTITLVSPSQEVLCRPACPRAMLSDDMFPQNKLFVDIQAQFSTYSPEQFRFVHGLATDLDVGGRRVTVTLSGQEGEEGTNIMGVSFEVLVIATGASTVSPLLGLNGSDASVLRGHWESFREKLASVRSVVVAGGGPAGVEVAGELGEYWNGRVAGGWFNLFVKGKETRVKITLVSGSERILSYLRESIASEAERLLNDVGVEVVKAVRVVTSSEEEGRVRVKMSDGRELTADLYLPCIGTTPNTGFVRPEDRGKVLTEDGRVRTDSRMRVEGGNGIYAIGDVSSYARAAVHNVLAEVPVLCASVAADLGVEEVKERVFVEDTRETQLVPVGRRKAVGAAMGWRLPGFLVWLIKGRDYWLWTTGRLWSGRQWVSGGV